MALTIRTLYRNCYCLYNITKPVNWSVGKNYPLRVLASGICYENKFIYRPLPEVKQLGSSVFIRQCTTQNINRTNESPQKPDEKKPGLIQKFKEMYKNYWYVLVPVHIFTSALWFGSFYYTVRSGIDILSWLEALGVSEKLMAPLRDSSAGYVALTFALYKIATPLRYAVTIGGTTFAIRKLTKIGWIKPVPSRERIKEMIQEKRENLQDRFIESKQHYQTQIKEKHSQVLEEMRRYKTEMRNIKNKVKKT